MLKEFIAITSPLHHTLSYFPCNCIASDLITKTLRLRTLHGEIQECDLAFLVHQIKGLFQSS
jgi:hypothetical protein